MAGYSMNMLACGWCGPQQMYHHTCLPAARGLSGQLAGSNRGVSGHKASIDLITESMP